MAASERARLPTRLAQSALSERNSRAKPLPMAPGILRAKGGDICPHCAAERDHIANVNKMVGLTS
ncbi:MAG: hypothetical protein L0J73_04020, partial [Halomonas sp.]|nr:hypothetical protein [Halomonas sp.]